jgi:hypothetical protein
MLFSCPRQSGAACSCGKEIEQVAVWIRKIYALLAEYVSMTLHGTILKR